MKLAGKFYSCYIIIEHLGYFDNITMQPAVINSTPMTTFTLTGSFSNRKESRMVMTTLSLSIGATRDTSPVCSALK